MELAKKNFKKVFDKYKQQKLVEYVPNNENNHAFPHFRFLDQDRKPYKMLCTLIIRDFLNNKANNFKYFPDDINDFYGTILKQFSVDKVITDETKDSLKELFEIESQLHEIFLIVRGILAYDILFTVFSKRFRVDYGINFKNKRLNQAVPYR